MLVMHIRDFSKGCLKFPKFKMKISIPSFYQDNVKIQFSDTHVNKNEGFAASKRRISRR